MDNVIVKQPRVLPRQLMYRSIKRILDITLCLLISPIFILIMIVCSLAIYLSSGRPIFFVQERIGKGGRLFKMYKFRTMKLKIDDNQIRLFMKAYVRGEVKERDDGKKIFKPFAEQDVFFIGRLLRKFSLDELPNHQCH
jgi:lipopolysaccharide/colanic/teichoic acid biosynthesis glycosyltransferase